MKPNARAALHTVGAGLVILVFVWPFVHMLLMSFKPPKELFSTYFVFHPTLSNYGEVFQKLQLHRYFYNSIVVSVSSAFLSMLCGTLGAYSFARYHFRGSKFLLFLILFTRMMPPVGAVIPLFLMMKSWGLAGTHLSVILLFTAFQTPFVVWMMRGFFLGVPVEMEESAKIDGCSPLGAFFRITVPVSAPGLTATAIFAFTLSWNEFLFALIFTNPKTKTVPVVVPQLIGEMGILWGQICAAGILAVLPILLFSYLAQKNLIRGLTFGAVKG